MPRLLHRDDRERVRRQAPLEPLHRYRELRPGWRTCSVVAMIWISSSFAGITGGMIITDGMVGLVASAFSRCPCSSTKAKNFAACPKWQSAARTRTAVGVLGSTITFIRVAMATGEPCSSLLLGGDSAS